MRVNNWDSAWFARGHSRSSGYTRKFVYASRCGEGQELGVTAGELDPAIVRVSLFREGDNSRREIDPDHLELPVAQHGEGAPGRAVSRAVRFTRAGPGSNVIV